MPLLWLSLAFIGGVILGELAGRPASWWLAATLGSLMVLFLWMWQVRRIPGLPNLMLRLPNPDHFPPSSIPIPLILLVIFLGGARYQSVQPTWADDFVARYNDLERDVILTGVVAQPPDERDQYTLLTIEADSLRFSEEDSLRAVRGLVLVRLSNYRQWHYGDRVGLQGWLETPAENEEFSYRDYLARKGIYATMSNPQVDLLVHGQGNHLLVGLYGLREHARRTLYQLYPDPEASLLIGILLGVETGIPESVSKAFQDSGTAHIVAISGFNMAIVASLFAGLFGRLLGKRKGALAAILAIAIYTVFVGAAPPVVRAALMSGLAVFAAQVGRRGNGLNTLMITAAVMVFFDPNILWDIGFQLSFFATLGLILYAGPLVEFLTCLAERLLPGGNAKHAAELVGEYFLFTLAVLLTTVPVTVYHFGRLPLLTPLSNLTVLPAQPAVMILGGISLLAGMIALPLGQVTSYLAWPFLVYSVRMAEFWAQFQTTILDLGRFGLWVVIAFYALLLGITFGHSRVFAWWKDRETVVNASPVGWSGAKSWLERNANILVSGTLVVMGVAAFLVWRAALAAPDGNLHLVLMDVNGSAQSGEALLIQTPTGRFVLINGGPSASALSDGLGRRLPPGRKELDYLVVAGVEDEQLAGLPPNLNRYPPRQVLWAGPTGGTRAARQVQENLAGSKIPIIPAQSGQSLDLGKGARLKVLSANERGAILLLEWGNFRALLPLGLDSTALDWLTTEGNLSPLSALLLAGSGYAPLNPPALIRNLQPQMILLSVASGDRRNRPDVETLQMLQDYPLLRTDQNGWIDVISDGKQVWVQVEQSR